MAEVKATFKNQPKDEEGNDVGEATTRVAAVDYDFGPDVNGMINELGAEVVFQHAKGSITVNLQNSLRQWMAQGLSETEIEEKMVDWAPPSGKPRSANKMEKIAKLLEGMSPDQREELLRQAME